ncbi:MAG: glycosyltransferase family 39 protein [Anaerolineales bacterium]
MILAPLLAYLTLILSLATLKPTWNWGKIALRGGLLWGSYAVVVTELLSVQSWITREGVFLAWLLPLSFTLGWLIWHAIKGGRIRIPKPSSSVRWYEIVLLAGIASVVLVTGIVAWFSPPQTWDSLNYHMPRVAHWAQQGSVRHFATGIEVQNSRTPAAEFLVLHAYVLGSGDRYATFVQWLAMVLSLVGVATLAGQLGAGRSGRLAGALFAATLPMGIIQASSTVTDYVVALWLVAGVIEVLRLRDGDPGVSTIAFLGLATGLALATKPTAVAYLAPFLAYAAYLSIRTSGWVGAAKAAAVGVAIVLVLNAAHLTRNVLTYGRPLNPAQVEIHSNENRGPGGTLSNLLRHVGLQVGTPSPHVNKALAVSVQAIHGILGLEVNDPRTTAHGVFKISQPTTNEDRAGNPLHTYMLVFLAASALWRRDSVPRILWVYLLLLAIGMVVLSFLLKWQIFAARYHLPFFVLAAPAAGYLMVRVAPKRWILVFGSLMLVAALPWLLQIKSRPLIPSLGDSYLGSISSEPREVLMLANGLNLLEPYQEMSRQITESGCRVVGISLSGNAAEYPLWVLLGAPSSELEIQWIVSGTPSAEHAVADFKPCAIICESCPQEQDQQRGLPRVGRWADFALYLAEPAD